MGMLLTFQPRGAAKPRPKPNGEATASIIIFPGVRYEPSGALERLGKILVPPDLPKPGPVQY